MGQLAKKKGGRRRNNFRRIIDEWRERNDPTAELDLTDCDMITAYLSFIPDNVIHLNLTDNQIDNIDSLPNTIQILNISQNPIRRINRLPENLQDFDAEGCLLLEYIAEFPDTLGYIHIAYCPRLTALPRLPDYLSGLYVRDTLIPTGTVLELPRTLGSLNIDDGIFELTVREYEEEGLVGPIELNELVIGDYTHLWTDELPEHLRRIFTISPHVNQVRVRTPAFMRYVPNMNFVNAPGAATVVENAPLNTRDRFPVPARNYAPIRFNANAENAMLTNIRENNIVARIAGVPNSTDPGHYLVVNSPGGDVERKDYIRRQRNHLMLHGNPLTREVVRSYDNLDMKRVVRGGTRRHRRRSTRRKARTLNRKSRKHVRK
jgi:hypothetical protein